MVCHYRVLSFAIKFVFSSFLFLLSTPALSGERFCHSGGSLLFGCGALAGLVSLAEPFLSTIVKEINL